MKQLIAILSCKAHAAYQQAQRETWVKHVPANVDFFYFVGHKDGLLADEITLGEDVIDPSRGLKLYPALPAKVKLLCRWALDNGYDRMFKTDTDTLVNPVLLMNPDFEKHNYLGAYNHEEAGEFASGGAGYWLSSLAMQVVAETKITSWAEDVFVALALRAEGILPVWNKGFRWEPGEVVDKDMITLHLPSALRRRPYDPAWMYEHYDKMKEFL
jgi:hypothetical protein